MQYATCEIAKSYFFFFIPFAFGSHIYTTHFHFILANLRSRTHATQLIQDELNRFKDFLWFFMHKIALKWRSRPHREREYSQLGSLEKKTDYKDVTLLQEFNRREIYDRKLIHGTTSASN